MQLTDALNGLLGYVRQPGLTGQSGLSDGAGLANTKSSVVAPASALADGTATDASQVAAPTDTVTLSDAARQLRSHPMDLGADAQLLDTLTMQALGSSGMVSAADLKGAKISLNSIAAATYSETSVSISGQQNGQSNSVSAIASVGDAQALSGSGSITLADGRVIQFQTELDTAEVAQASISQNRADNTPSAPDSTTASASPTYVVPAPAYSSVSSSSDSTTATSYNFNSSLDMSSQILNLLAQVLHQNPHHSPNSTQSSQQQATQAVAA